MEYLNRIEISGRVGSHTIELRKNGSWAGCFDLHSKGLDGAPIVFDCRVEEDGAGVKDLAAGIGGKFVRVEGRMVQFNDTSNDRRTKLNVEAGANPTRRTSSAGRPASPGKTGGGVPLREDHVGRAGSVRRGPGRPGRGRRMPEGRVPGGRRASEERHQEA